MTDIKLCTQIPLDPELQAWADELSVWENPGNNPHPNGYNTQTHGQHAAAPVKRLWSNNRQVRVRINRGCSDKIKRKIKKYAQEWNNHSGVKFVFVESGDAEVRVNVNRDGPTWSCIGTECLAIPQDQATMTFGWLTDTTQEMEFARVILHEFGHALGFIHEHQSPVAGISWNTERVYAYYADRYGWSTDLVDQNIFSYYHYPHKKASHGDDWRMSSFDSLSIMTYAIPVSLTTNGFFTAPNTRLSRDDKDFVAYLYPPNNAMS